MTKISMKQEIQKKIEELTELLKYNNYDFFISVMKRNDDDQPVEGIMKISDSEQGYILLVSSFLALVRRGGSAKDLYDILCAVKDNQKFLDKVEEIEVV